MKIIHHISFNNLTKPGLVDFIRNQQINFKKNELPGGKENFIVSFDILESDERWEKVKSRVVGLVDIVNTIFTKEEILSSKWIRLLLAFETGFPEPKNSWTKDKNYSICAGCGIRQQHSSFRIKNEPKLQGHDFMTMFWLSELFCTNRVVDQFKKHEIKGYKEKEVLLNKTGEPSEEIIQLNIPNSTKPGLLATHLLNPKECKQCGLVKYEPHKKGPMRFSNSAFDGISTDIILSNEWFGSGHSAYREYIISNNLANLIFDKSWQGVILQPIELI